MIVLILTQMNQIPIPFSEIEIQIPIPIKIMLIKIFTKKKIPKKHFQIFRRLMHAFFQIRVICANHGIPEIPGILCKNIIGYIKSK